MNMKNKIILLFICTISVPQYAFSEIIYQLIIDRFNRGECTHCVLEKDSSHLRHYQGGNINGIREKIPYFKKNKIDTLLLNPVLENTTMEIDRNGTETKYHSYHGYHTLNFNKIDPHIGKEIDFIKLVNEAHKNKIKIYLDIVLNHRANIFYNKWCEKCSYETHEHLLNKVYPLWMRNKKNFNLIKLYNPEMTMQQDLVNSEFEALDDFKLQDENVANKIIDIYFRLIKKYKIDGVRIDTARYLPYQFLQRFKRKLLTLDHISEESFLFEYISPTGEIPSQYQKLGSHFNYKLYKSLKEYFEGKTPLAKLFIEIEKTIGSHLDFNFVSSHDFGRLTGHLKSEKEVETIYALFALISKRMMFYYGDEYHLKGKGIFHHARENLFVKGNINDKKKPLVNMRLLSELIKIDVKKAELKKDLIIINTSEQSKFIFNLTNRSITLEGNVVKALSFVKVRSER